MQPADRPYPVHNPGPPGKAHRQFKQPLHTFHSRIPPHETSHPADQLTRPIPLSELKENQARTSHIYEKLDTTLPKELLHVSSMNSMRLMQVSGALRSIQLVPYDSAMSTDKLISETFTGKQWWLDGPQFVDKTPSWHGISSDESSPLEELQVVPATTEQTINTPAQTHKTAFWKSPTLRFILTLLAGIGLFALIARFVNMHMTMYIIEHNLSTPRGMLFAGLAALSLTGAYCIRGGRWYLFLRPIGRVKLIQAIQLFWIAIFINFILPVQGGELAKTLMLKRICAIPVSRSLPTVAMDKTLDLLPALIIMVLIPFIPGICMSPTLWIILGAVGGILCGIILTIIVMALSRPIATKLIHLCLSFLPRGLAGKIESFAFGFIDSLLAGASRPKIFIPAILLTIVAVTCDGLFALFSFWAVGVNDMTFWVAILGYSIYTMFYILPTPPGHIGSNEFAGFIVFSQLLGYKQNDVAAMFIFSHPLGALIMGLACLICLSNLGISFSKAISLKHESETSPQIAS